jgi:Flp pilus assembly protein TadG
VLGRLRSRSETGQDLVEFALLLPLLLAVTFGIIDSGVVVFSYTTIANAAREGTHYGTTQPGFASGTKQTWASPSNRMGLAACGLTRGLGTSMIQVTPSLESGSAVVRVQVNYAANLLSGILFTWAGIPKTINLSAVARMQRE